MNIVLLAREQSQRDNRLQAQDDFYEEKAAMVVSIRCGGHKLACTPGNGLPSLTCGVRPIGKPERGNLDRVGYSHDDHVVHRILEQQSGEMIPAVGSALLSELVDSQTADQQIGHDAPQLQAQWKENPPRLVNFCNRGDRQTVPSLTAHQSFGNCHTSRTSIAFTRSTGQTHVPFSAKLDCSGRRAHELAFVMS